VIVDSAEAIANAYVTGRGSFGCGRSGSRRISARHVEPDHQRNPYQVPKSKLIEQIAALISEKKLPILEDVRDESDEQIRIVLQPRSRS
jgi:topoisomerase-4 subunit A